MVWHDRLSEGHVPTQDDVAAVLPPNGKANLLKRPNHLRAGNLGEPVHTATTSASKCSGGTDSLSSSVAIEIGAPPLSTARARLEKG